MMEGLDLMIFLLILSVSVVEIENHDVTEKMNISMTLLAHNLYIKL